MLHCLRDTEDTIEDAAAVMLALAATTDAVTDVTPEGEGEEKEETTSKKEKNKQKGKKGVSFADDEDDEEEEEDEDANIVGRPVPSLVQLSMALFDRSTGLLSSVLQMNMNREASPLDLALLRASRRPPWSLYVEEIDAAPPAAGEGEGASSSSSSSSSSFSPTIIVAQERALLLRRGPEYSQASQVHLRLGKDEPLFQPGCWTVAFSPSTATEGAKWVAVGGWSGAVYIFPTSPPPAPPTPSQTATDIHTQAPINAIPPPFPAPWHPMTMPPGELFLLAGLAWRGNDELLTLRYSGFFSRHRVWGAPGGGGGKMIHALMDLRSWHRGGCSAMAYDKTSERVVISGGSLRKEHATVVTVWRLAPPSPLDSSTQTHQPPPLIIEHQLALPVGTPFLLKPTEIHHQQASFLRHYLGGAGLASYLDSKIPVQCPILHLSLSPHGGQYLAAVDLEGGLSLFALQQDAWGPLGGRMTSLPLAPPSSSLATEEETTNNKSITSIAELAWWSPISLAVLDKKGHAHILQLPNTHTHTHTPTLHFHPLLSTDLPIGRGASLACPGDDHHLLVLQSYVGLHGRLRGKLVQLNRSVCVCVCVCVRACVYL